MAELTNVGKVILGALAFGPHSGYEVKQLVDRSTRFFWAASYGQIYPELRRLEGEGLVTGASEPRGGRERQVYRLTAKGRRALAEWLTGSEAVYELRDEGLLRLFFADGVGGDDTADLVARLREEKQVVLDRLRDIRLGLPARASGSRMLVLEYGIEMHAWIVEWCERVERELDAKARKEIVR